MEHGSLHCNAGSTSHVSKRLRSLRAALAASVCVLAAIGFSAAQAVAAQAAPPGLPGPPPGAGSGFPLPPPPGQGPGAQPLGPPTAIPTGASGPGLLSGTANLRGTRVTLTVACTAGGRASLSAPSVANGTLASARYRCSRRRASVRLSLPTAAAGRIARAGQVLASVAFVQPGTTERLSLTLAVRPQPASYWTSEFGLRCNRPGYQPQLLAPNFSDTRPTTIDVRPWLAWYTAATGWHWIGTMGANASRWYRWTATPTGVAEWQTSGAITPWTWSPISVSPGRGTYVIAAFEAIYWYEHPEYVWSYARSGQGESVVTTYCVYP